MTLCVTNESGSCDRSEYNHRSHTGKTPRRISNTSSNPEQTLSKAFLHYPLAKKRKRTAAASRALRSRFRSEGGTFLSRPFGAFVEQFLFIAKSEDYLKNSRKQAKVKSLEREINQHVYKLYDFTPNEIKIMESL